MIGWLPQRGFEACRIALLGITVACAACGGEDESSQAACLDRYPLCGGSRSHGPTASSSIATSGSWGERPFEQACDFSAPGDTYADLCREPPSLPGRVALPDLLNIRCAFEANSGPFDYVALSFGALPRAGTYTRTTPWLRDMKLPYFDLEISPLFSNGLETLNDNLEQVTLVLEHYDVCEHIVSGTLDGTWNPQPLSSNPGGSAKVVFDVPFAEP